MGNRYDNRIIFKNEDESYRDILEERGVPFIRYYGTSRMLVPNARQRSDLTRIRHVWSAGDRFYKLAIRYYDDPQYWWVIALYNQLPTEANARIGDVVIIPLPLNNVLRVTKS